MVIFVGPPANVVHHERRPEEIPLGKSKPWLEARAPQDLAGALGVVLAMPEAANLPIGPGLVGAVAPVGPFGGPARRGAGVAAGVGDQDARRLPDRVDGSPPRGQGSALLSWGSRLRTCHPAGEGVHPRRRKGFCVGAPRRRCRPLSILILVVFVILIGAGRATDHDHERIFCYPAYFAWPVGRS